MAENEFMNNILLHCFITKHYANDLFDFLFAYYQIDLERDLSRNSAEMRTYLMQTMSKGEASARAYKIKKHTADAVSANEQGCKIRVAERVGEDNIVSAVIHLDEKTPHMHLCFVPLTKDHRLCAKEILGNRTHLSKYWQDGFFEYMHEQYLQLERGEPAAETKRKHIPVWLYKKGEHLDRMYGQVKEILDNIGILNAKGKSKEALELLRQWSKEGEYFSSKIKEVTGHIDGLNAEVNKWQSKYNSERRMVEQMSDYNKAANSTIEEQEYEIGRLIRQNDRYRELLDRIPDEIYEEITNTRSKNRDRGER